MLAAEESAVVETNIAPAILNLGPAGWDNVMPAVTSPNVGLGNEWNSELDDVLGELDSNALINFGWNGASPFVPPLPVQGARHQVSTNRCGIQQKYDS